MMFLWAVSSFLICKVKSVRHEPKSRYNLTLLPHYTANLSSKRGYQGRFRWQLSNGFCRWRSSSQSAFRHERETPFARRSIDCEEIPRLCAFALLI